METGLGKKVCVPPRLRGSKSGRSQEAGAGTTQEVGGKAGAKALGAVLGVLKQVPLAGLVRGAGRGPAGPDAWWPQKQGKQRELFLLQSCLLPDTATPKRKPFF